MRVDKLISQYHAALERLGDARRYRNQFKRAWERASDYYFSLDLVIEDWMKRDENNKIIYRPLATYVMRIFDGKMWQELESAFSDVENAVIDRKKFVKIIEKHIPAFEKQVEEEENACEEAKSKIAEEYWEYLHSEFENQDFAMDLLEAEPIRSVFLKFLLQEE